MVRAHSAACIRIVAKVVLHAIHTAVILLADPQESVDYAVALTARHGLVVLVSQPEPGITLQFM